MEDAMIFIENDYLTAYASVVQVIFQYEELIEELEKRNRWPSRIESFSTRYRNTPLRISHEEKEIIKKLLKI